MAAAIAARYGEAARAVLFYGSCLRQRELGGLMLDFYLIVSDYREAYGRGWLRFRQPADPAQRLSVRASGPGRQICRAERGGLRAGECGPEAGSVSVWARFAQPARLVWAKDEAARERTIASVARAAPTLFALTCPMMASGADDPVAVFRAGFELTYGAELRAERQERSGAIVDADPDYYRRLGVAVLAAGLPPERRRRAEARALAGAAAQGQGADRGPADEGEHDLRRRDRLPRLEDQPPRRDADRGQALAAALAAGRRAYSAASPVEARAIR